MYTPRTKKPSVMCIYFDLTLSIRCNLRKEMRTKEEKDYSRAIYIIVHLRNSKDRNTAYDSYISHSISK